MELDLIGTFRFAPAVTAGVVDCARVRWTIDVLDLNKPVLATARRNAYGSYGARLFEYAERKRTGTKASDLNELKCGFLQMPHPTVFLEMQRRATSVPALAKLFRPVPEALGWTFAARPSV